MLHETHISGGGTDTVRAFWKSYITNAIENTKSAWNEVRNTTLSAAWKNIWPECYRSSSTSMLSTTFAAQTDIREEIWQLGRSSDREDLADVDIQDIKEVINAHNAEMSIEELCSQYEDNSVIGIGSNWGQLQRQNYKSFRDFRNGGPLHRKGKMVHDWERSSNAP
ncbi:putative DDE superfamily endonuclease [Trypoxylus dichotomus]